MIDNFSLLFFHVYFLQGNLGLMTRATSFEN